MNKNKTKIFATIILLSMFLPVIFGLYQGYNQYKTQQRIEQIQKNQNGNNNGDVSSSE